MRMAGPRNDAPQINQVTALCHRRAWAASVGKSPATVSRIAQSKTPPPMSASPTAGSPASPTTAGSAFKARSRSNWIV